jgi:predicted phosphodiesterase
MLTRIVGDNQSFIYTGGHVHSQLLRRIGDTFYFRPGSVGRVYDRNRMNTDFRLDAWAEYAILNVTESQSSIEFRRTPIDVEKVKNVWLNSGRPDAEREASLYYQEKVL